MNKKLFLIPATIAGMSLVACGGSKPEPTPKATYKVALGKTQAIELDNKEAIEETDFNANLKVKSAFQGFCEMPDSEDKVDITITGQDPLTTDDFVFTKVDDNNAKINIPAKFITGDVVISLVASPETGTIECDSPQDESSNPIYFFTEDKYTYGDSIEGYIELNQGESDYYNLPETIKVETSDLTNETTDITKYCKYNKENGKLYIPAIHDGEYLLNKKVTIKPTEHRPHYSFECDSDSLTFTNTPEGVDKGSPVNFNITVKDTSTYYLPTSLSILVGTSYLQLGSDYKIIPSNADGEAIVAIFGKVINGSVHVKGEAQKIDGYAVELDGACVTLKGESTIAKKNQSYHVTFKADANHTIPAASNVVVRIGDGHTVDDWIPADSSDKLTYVIKGDEAALTIDKELVTGNITVAAKAADISLLEYATEIDPSWEYISKVAGAGYAYYLFDIGEISSPFTLKDDASGIKYRARLIGINRDKAQDVESRPMAMTFEFTTCISTAQRFGKKYNLSSYYYKGSETYQSELYEYLNKTLINKLPFAKTLYNYNTDKDTVTGIYNADLPVIKTVTRSSSYLFPLSLRELGLSVNDINEHHSEEVPHFAAFGRTGSGPYEYYEHATDDMRIKTAIINGESQVVRYWTRSPYVETSNAQSYVISTKGVKGTSNCRGADVYVAPAFCM